MPRGFTKLTRGNIRSLQPGDRLVENGIAYEHLAGGDGRFTVNIMVDGMRIHRVVGRTSDGTNRTQAVEFIEKIRRDARENRLALPKGRKVALSVRDAAKKYLDRQNDEGGRDLKMKRTRLEHHVVTFFGDMPLSRISGFDIDRYKKHRSGQPAQRGRTKDGKPVFAGITKVATINRELAVLSHLLNKAVEWGWIAHRPAKIRRFKEGSGRIVYLTVEQTRSLLEQAKQDQNPQIYPFILIALETAMRRMEILSIRREHIDLDRQMIQIPTAKAGARDQPITEHLAIFLKGQIAAMPSAAQWLFPSASSKHGHTMDIRKPFRRVVTAAGLDPDQVVRHTLRHTAITHLVQAGVDLPTVKRISGHKTLIMVERYAHANGEHIRAAMQKLDERYRKVG